MVRSRISSPVVSFTSWFQMQNVDVSSTVTRSRSATNQALGNLGSTVRYQPPAEIVPIDFLVILLGLTMTDYVSREWVEAPPRLQ